MLPSHFDNLMLNLMPISRLQINETVPGADIRIVGTEPFPFEILIGSDDLTINLQRLQDFYAECRIIFFTISRGGSRNV